MPGFIRRSGMSKIEKIVALCHYFTGREAIRIVKMLEK